MFVKSLYFKLLYYFRYLLYLFVSASEWYFLLDWRPQWIQRSSDDISRHPTCPSGKPLLLFTFVYLTVNVVIVTCKKHVTSLLIELNKPLSEYDFVSDRLLHIELGLKIYYCVLRRLTVISDCTGTRVENDTWCARHKQYTRGLHISPHTSTYNTPCVVLHVWCMHVCRWLHGLECTMYIMPERSMKKVPQYYNMSMCLHFSMEVMLSLWLRFHAELVEKRACNKCSFTLHYITYLTKIYLSVKIYIRAVTTNKKTISKNLSVF